MAPIPRSLITLAQRRDFWALGVLLASLLLPACNRPAPVSSNSSSAAPEVRFGTPISFAQGGNAEPYKISGWSQAEEKFTWSEGSSAQLRIPIAATNDPVVLKMRIATLIKPPDLPFQPVEVYVNDQKIAEWHVGEMAEFTAALPGDIAKLGGVLTINIKTPKATSPKALGLSADPRVLGICCHSLELSKG